MILFFIFLYLLFTVLTERERIMQNLVPEIKYDSVKKRKQKQE